MIKGGMFLGALLNFVPGFGLGYPVVGRQRAFRICIVAWVLSAFAAGVLSMTAGALWEFSSVDPEPK